MAQNYLDRNEEKRAKGKLFWPSPLTTRCQTRTATGSSLKMRETRNADYHLFGSLLLQCLTHQESGQQRVLLAAIVMINNNLENNMWHLIKESQ